MAKIKISQDTHLHTRFPRSEAMLEAARISTVLRAAADELETISALAAKFDEAVLRGVTRSIVASVVRNAVELEGDES